MSVTSATSSSSMDSPSSSSSSSSPQSPIKRETPLTTPDPASSHGLPHNCTSKYVEDWLVRNRFSILAPVFASYTSNDLLRLSKDDVVKLCGPADGIRLFNLAHNIQIKPKLSIFITFTERSFYSAVFLTEWKAEFLIRKIISAYFGFVKSPAKDQPTTCFNPDPIDTTTCNHLINSHTEYELFVRVRGILVKTSDEVLNNLQDQARFLVKFELPSEEAAALKMNLVKIIMIPLD